MTRTVFIDTSFFVAIINSSDNNHILASNIWELILKEGYKGLLTDAILIEFGNTLSSVRWREKAYNLVENLLSQKNIMTVLTPDRKILLSAWELFRKYSDKEWGLTDCISFIVMKKYKISEVLTFEHHFEQAGFINLIKNL